MIRYFKKSFVRYLAYGLAIALLSFLFGIIKPKAYVTLEERNGNRINPNAYGIIDPYQNWDMSAGSYWSIRDPWLVTPSQFWYAGGVHGTNISVVADYLIGVKQEPYSDATLTNYLYSAQNTLKASNLRCGIGDYKQGYDATYAPVVSDFDASFVQVDHVTGSQYLYHIRFRYEQQIREVNVNSTNMSCWFVREPSNGLFAQTYWATSSDTLRFYSQNVNVSYSVSMDPNTAILNNITNQNATMIDQNNQIISGIGGVSSGINNLNSNITDSNPPDNLDALSNSAGWLPAGPVDSILSLPLSLLNNLINNMQRTCTPVSLPLPFVDSNLELPCVNSLYAQMGDVSNFINGTVGVVASAFILFYYLLHLYKYVDDTLTFRENNFIDNWSGV